MQLSCYSVSASRRSSLFHAKGSTNKDKRNNGKEKMINILVTFSLIAVISGEPGLLRVPKVYNAVITSNQNLSPSRAYPVIQPVVHRTAIGYVPPFYYSQTVPQVSGPEAISFGQTATKENSQSNIRLEPTIEQSKITTVEEAQEKNAGGTNKKEEQEPFSFYPNYQSLYYDPYFYTYNGFNPHLVPGTYYVDYHPYKNVEPIPASTPKNGDAGHLLPAFHEEKRISSKDEKEKIPDVPPPPLPTAVPKSS